MTKLIIATNPSVDFNLFLKEIADVADKHESINNKFGHIEYAWIAAFFEARANAKYKTALEQFIIDAPKKFDYEPDPNIKTWAEVAYHLAHLLNSEVYHLDRKVFSTLFHFLNQTNSFGKFIVELAKNPHHPAVAASYFLKLNRGINGEKVGKIIPGIRH